MQHLSRALSGAQDRAHMNKSGQQEEKWGLLGPSPWSGSALFVRRGQGLKLDRHCFFSFLQLEIDSHTIQFTHLLSTSVVFLYIHGCMQESV